MILCGAIGYIESLLLEETFKVIVVVFGGGGGGCGGGSGGGIGGNIFTPVVKVVGLDDPYMSLPTGDNP